MNSSTSTRSSNVSEGNRTDIALPLAAVISLAITCYVIVVLVGEYRLFVQVFFEPTSLAVDWIYLIYRNSNTEVASQNLLFEQ